MGLALLLDLDDTLYDEMDYVRSGFRAVAGHLKSEHPGLDIDGLALAMEDALARHGRGAIFNQALAAHGIEVAPKQVAELVELYRHHRPEIALHPGVPALLDRLASRHDLALVTDGAGVMQRAKVEALGLAHWIGTRVYCWEVDAPKPSPEGHRLALRNLARPIADAVVVGDNPAHDMAAAKALGCRAIRVLSGRHAGVACDPAFAPDAEIGDILGLEATLALWE